MIGTDRRFGSIEKAAPGTQQYEGLRDLWCRVFGDEPGFVDLVYSIFGEDAAGYVIRSDAGKAVSALTCYRCGDLGGVPVYVIYAVSTDPEYRGLGLAGRITEYVRKAVTAPKGSVITFRDDPDAEGMGGIAIVSPAEDSLSAFYGKLGFAHTCKVRVTTLDASSDDEEFIPDEDEDFEAFEPGFSIAPAEGAEYNMYREAFLSGIEHVALSDAMLRLVRAESMGGSGLMAINGGDAVCAVRGLEPDGPGEKELYITELVVNPALREFSEEIENEIALRLMRHYSADKVTFRTPVWEGGSCEPSEAEQGITLQSMASGNGDTEEFYFGFPLE